MSQSISFNSRSTSRPKYSEVTYDSFTGLKDKTALLSDIQQKMYKKENISVGMFDMDNFKSVNELLGYKVGDEFIKAISQDISIVAKTHGVDTYRFGGDEFVVLLFENTSIEEKKQVVKEIQDRVTSNPVIQSRSKEYLENAEKLLDVYERDNNKVKELINLNLRHSIFHEIYDMSTIAREDPYITKALAQVDDSRQQAYQTILQESIETEGDLKVKKVLSSYSYDVDGKKESIDEYILGRYDKNHEIFRLKRWLRDFNRNGFSLTGGIVDFKPSFYRGKQPIDIVNNVGEVLKEQKAFAKGGIQVREMV